MSTAPSSVLKLDDEVRRIAREGAPDRYLAALLAPQRARAGLIALAAFAAEIEKIPRQVSEPHLGEIRIQWWRDALAPSAKFEASGHPVADAVTLAIAQHGLTAASFDDFLDAHVHGLYADAPETDGQLQLELDMTEGALFRLAARCLGAPETEIESARDVIQHAAEAYGLTRLALQLPYSLSRGRMPLPPSLAPADANDPAQLRAALQRVCALARSHLAHVSSAYAAQPKSIRTALLPVALVEPYLRALSDAAHDPRRDLADIAPLTRTWRLAKTHMRGRIG